MDVPSLPHIVQLEPITVNLQPYGFPAISGPEELADIKLGVFYVSRDRLAVHFDRQLAGADPHSHAFQLLVLSTEGHTTAQLTLRGDPKAIDIRAAPDGGVLVGREGQVDFYDSKLELVRSMPIPRTTTGIEFDRRRNQLVILTIERELGHRTAHFVNGNTLEESATLTYPVKSWAVFGQNQLVYTVPGDCRGAAHVVPNQHNWRFLDNLPACDSLTFITDETLAYAFDRQLHVVNSNGKELLQARIPAPDTFAAPAFVGVSDDGNRLAIRAVEKKHFSRGWPYYDEVFVYDLGSGHEIFQRTLTQSHFAVALSPDGHQLATVERGIITLIPVP